MNKKIAGIGLASIAVLSLAACGHRGASKSGGKSDSLKVAMVTDTGGVDDKSFNQSGWEGMQAWGKKNGLKKGAGFDYFQSVLDFLFMMLLIKQQTITKMLITSSLMMLLKGKIMLQVLSLRIMNQLT